MVKINQKDNPAYNSHFLTGIFYLWTAKYEKSRHNLLKAVNETDPMEALYPVYQSYLGLLEILNEKKDGLYYCHNAAEKSQTLEFEILLNLAFAEFISGNRKRTIKTLDEVACLKLIPKQVKELKAFHQIIGKRQMNSKGALTRNSFLRRSIGKIFRHSSKLNIQRVEAFIRKTVKTRYKSKVHQLQRQTVG